MRTLRASFCVAIATAAVAAFVSGCGDDLGECPANSDAQQAQGLEVLQTRCMTCHSSKVSGNARLGAPSDLNFDDAAIVSDEAGEMYGEVQDGAMPPGGGLSDAETEALRVYLACQAN